MSLKKSVCRSENLKWFDPLPASAAVQVDEFIMTSGRIAVDGEFRPVAVGDVTAQARYAFNRLKEVLADFGATTDNIVEVISFHKAPRAWEIVMNIGHEFFDKDKGPAWTPVGTSGLFKEGFLHEIMRSRSFELRESEPETTEKSSPSRKFIASKFIHFGHPNSRGSSQELSFRWQEFGHRNRSGIWNCRISRIQPQPCRERTVENAADNKKRTHSFIVIGTSRSIWPI